MPPYDADADESWFLGTVYLYEYLMDSLGQLPAPERDRVYREMHADPELAATWLLAQSRPQQTAELSYDTYVRMRDTLLSMRDRFVGRMLTADELIEVFRAKRAADDSERG